MLRLRQSRRRRAGLALATCIVAAVTSAVVAQARPTAAAPFKIAVITGINTTQNNLPEMVAGAQAAAKAINKQGGLGGRPVEIVPCSTQSLAAVAAECARQAVAQGVDDFIEYNSFEGNTIPIAEAAGIPHIGSYLVSPSDFYAKTMVPVFPIPTNSAILGLYAALKGKKNVRVAAIGQINAGSNLGINMAKQLTKRMHQTWAGTLTLQPTTDFSPIVQKLKELNPDIVLDSLSLAPFAAYKQAQAQLGLKVIDVWTAFIVGEQDAQGYPDKCAQCYLGAALPPTSSNVPGMKLFRAQLADAGLAGDPTNFKIGGAMGWLDVWSLKKLSARVKGPITKDSLLAAARKAKHVDLFGLVDWSPGLPGPSAFPNQPNGNAYLLRVVNGKYSLLTKKPVDVWQILGVRK
jgi:ABC-type branched-subunit amino acid transport system substrate-binding protein